MRKAIKRGSRGKPTVDEIIGAAKVRFRGRKNECLFTEPIVNDSEIESLTSGFPDFIEKIEQSGDDRSFVIVAALVLENRIDSLLKIWIPKYEDLSKNNDFTFSLKIELLRSFKLIPPRILACADCARRVRNEFAHNLGIASFRKIDVKILKKLKGLYENLYNHSSAGVAYKNLFREVAYFSIVGVRLYTRNISYLRSAIESRKVLKIVDEDYKKRKLFTQRWKD